MHSELIENGQETPRNNELVLEKSFITAYSERELDFPNFKGTKVFTFPTSRTRLPFYRPDDPIPLTKIIKMVIGKDISKVSLPVIINEPSSMLQKNGEGVCYNHKIFERANEEQDSIKRLCLVVAGLVAP